MRITWITRSFLDYRVPVFDELSKLVDGNLMLIYYKDVVPLRVCQKTEQVLGENSIGLSGEVRLLGPRSWHDKGLSGGVRIPFQPGLVQAVRRSDPDVMVTDGFFQWTTAALWLRATRCIPHVTLYEPTAHMEQDAQWYRKAYRKAVLRWVDAICCNGRLCAEYTRSLGFPAERIPAYGHMVADVQGIRRATSSVSQTQINALKAQFDLKGVVFLYVGRLVPLKGIDRLLHAWQRFCSPMTSDGVTLLLVGDGPQRAALDKYCVDHSLHNVRFVGKVDYDALGPYYRVANTFVIPTLSDNWSLVVPEAMAAGLPVLCSQYNGCWPELVTPDNGWVFDPLDEADTVRCLQQCLAAKGRLPAMGSKSLEIVEGGHTPAHAAKAIYYTCQMAMRHCNGSNNDLL